MIPIRNRLAIFCFSLLVGLLVAVEAYAECPRGSRFAGTIAEPRGHVVQLKRSGASIDASGGFDFVCTGDIVFADSSDVELALKLFLDRTVTIRKGYAYQIPTAMQFLIQIIKDPSVVIREEGQQVSATTLGPDDPLGFGVAGLASGEARISLADRPLFVPVRSPQIATAKLYDPTGRVTATRSVTAGVGLVMFPPPGYPGIWTVSLATQDEQIAGHFRVVTGVATPGLEELSSLSARDRSLVLTCINVGENGLEALRHADDEASRQSEQALFWRWSDREAKDFCSGYPIDLGSR